MPKDIQFTNRQLRKIARERFLKSRRAETAYRGALVSVSRQVGSIIRGFAPRGIVENLPSLQATLEAYSVALRPWANAVTNRMHVEVGARDLKAWEELAKSMGSTLRAQLLKSPTAEYMRAALIEQVELITSLPLEAGNRVHELALRGLLNASRGEDIEKMILASGSVTASRARTIARTETARTSSLLTEARAQSIGADTYIWRTAGDSDVRKRHRHLEGRVFRFGKPPVTGDHGERSNPGQIYNCRCWAEPILPDRLLGLDHSRLYEHPEYREAAA